MRWLVVIPNYAKELKDLRMLERCIETLKDNEPGIMPHTLVIDDGSALKNARDFLEALQSKHHFNLVFNEQNLGYSKSVNVGLRMAMGAGFDAALTLNSDVELLTPFRQAFDTAFEHPDIRIAGGRLLYPTGKIQSAGFEILDNGMPHEYFKNEWCLASHHDSHKSRFVMGVTGALQAIRLPTGLYDEGFEMSYEDVEFCIRQWSLNSRVLYVPRVEAIHHESLSRGYFPGEREIKSIGRFHEMMASKYEVAKIRNQIASLNQLVFG